MKHFGLPYQGSKDKIALAIHEQLPAGERFVDLFGGGFAMSHAALLIKGKYKRVLYNELDPLLCRLIKEAISGKYNYDSFKPEFITREMFDALKDRDGYIKYIWSFSNSGKNYLFGKDVEPIKHAGHDYVIFGKPIPGVPLPALGNARQRRLALRQYGSQRAAQIVKKNPDLSKRLIEGKYELQQLEQLERLQQLEQLERLERLQQLEQLERLERLEQLERLERLEISNGDYRDYVFSDGDVVYCDPPYEGTADYGSGFDHKEFYEWVYTRPYQVWFSSYKISDERFRLVWAKHHRGIMGGAKNAVYNCECLYTNR